MIEKLENRLFKLGLIMTNRSKINEALVMNNDKCKRMQQAVRDDRLHDKLFRIPMPFNLGLDIGLYLGL